MNNNNSAQEVPQWLKDEAERLYPYAGLSDINTQERIRQAKIEGYTTAALKYAAKDEQVREEYENKLDYYIGLLCDCYNAGELNPQLQHKIWEALHCVPDRKPLNVKNIKNG